MPESSGIEIRTNYYFYKISVYIFLLILPNNVLLSIGLDLAAVHCEVDNIPTVGGMLSVNRPSQETPARPDVG
jgi:hypothetical protein